MATSILSHGMSAAKMPEGGVADRQAGPIFGDPVGVRHAHARGGAVPGEHDVGRPVDLGEVRQRAIGRLEHGGVQLQLLELRRSPSLRRSFPRRASSSCAGRAATTSPSPARRYLRRGQCRDDASRAASGCAASCPSRGRCGSCRAWSGANGPGWRWRAHRYASRAAWRRGRTRNGGAEAFRPTWPAPRGGRQPKWRPRWRYPSMYLSSQRARAALGRRGPPALLVAWAAASTD